MLRKLQHPRMLGGADHDRIDVARQDLGGVADGLGAAELHFGAGQEQRLAAELAHADIEGDAGAGRGLFEDHRQHLAGERLVALPGLEGLLAGNGVVHDDPEVGRRDCGEIEEVFGGSHCLYLSSPPSGWAPYPFKPSS
jgi:hypothetical protein